MGPTSAVTPIPLPEDIRLVVPLSNDPPVDPIDRLQLAAAASGLAANPDLSGVRTVEARLGVAAGLYTALHCKHQPTGDHSLRVALTCSTWAAALRMPDNLREILEVAALLHDIGKLGIPDSVLLKPGRLTTEEHLIVARHPELATHILSSAGAPKQVITAVRTMSVWFDGSNAGQRGSTAQPNVTARMLAIVDAFDSMTTDHVYRAAKSRDRALAELFHCAGTQFDPDLVRSFAEHFAQDQQRLRDDVARRWLASVGPNRSPTGWGGPNSSGEGFPTREPSTAFEQVLIEHMHDGVIFVDAQLRITLWNGGMQRMTGVDASAAVGRVISPQLLDMADDVGRRILETACPVQSAIRNGVQDVRRVSILGRSGRRLDVNLQVLPVQSGTAAAGAAIMLHDASSEATLEERCQSLHAQVTRDPLTQVANRAEFDRVLHLFVETHQKSGVPCSLIMADIDHFKRINDTFGHQAGDRAIISFATLLKSMCRAGDLVARYGGEEFAVLCADCSVAAAARRAEQMRKSLAELTHEGLGDKAFTASFGVTELQPGDTDETLLRRADRGLLQAKEQGRNQVVQLGGDDMPEETAKSTWWNLLSSGSALLERARRGGSAMIDTTLMTDVPMDIAIEKLRGFISDHGAKIVKTGENQLRLTCTTSSLNRPMRSGDKPITFVIDITFSQTHVEKTNTAGLAAGKYVQTFAAVQISPRRDGDRRRAGAVERGRMLLASLKSYLMAKEQTAEA